MKKKNLKVNDVLRMINDTFEECSKIPNCTVEQMAKEWKSILEESTRDENSIEPTREDITLWKSLLRNDSYKAAYECAKQYNFMRKHCNGCYWNEHTLYERPNEDHYIDGDCCGIENYDTMNRLIKSNEIFPKNFKMSCYTKLRNK